MEGEHHKRQKMDDQCSSIESLTEQVLMNVTRLESALHEKDTEKGQLFIDLIRSQVHSISLHNKIYTLSIFPPAPPPPVSTQFEREERREERRKEREM